MVNRQHRISYDIFKSMRHMKMLMKPDNLWMKYVFSVILTGCYGRNISTAHSPSNDRNHISCPSNEQVQWSIVSTSDPVGPQMPRRWSRSAGRHRYEGPATRTSQLHQDISSFVHRLTEHPSFTETEQSDRKANRYATRCKNARRRPCSGSPRPSWGSPRSTPSTRLFVVPAAVMFLSGAERNKGGIHRDLSAARAQQRRPRLRRRLLRVHGRNLRVGVHRGRHRRRVRDRGLRRHHAAQGPDGAAATLGVAMGQQYPAQPPYGGCSAKQPGGTTA
uniref:Uncharacterized protein n=1 Tax=Setaria italica TaxID=4555 RepID=K3YUW0_SETIT